MKRFNICGAAPIEPLESRRLLAAIVDRVLTIDGSAAVDTVTLRHGSTASSLLVRHNGVEQTFGQSSFDFIRISGGPGNDRVIVEYNGRSVPLWFLAGSGDDRLTNRSFEGPVHFYGVDGNDYYDSPYLPVTYDGAAGRDFLIIFDRATIDMNRYPTVELASARGGKLIGTALDNELSLHGGGTILGGGGNDRLYIVDSSPSHVDGGDGNDRLWVGFNAGPHAGVKFFGGSGHDTLHGGLGNDLLDGGRDADTIMGSDGVDEVTYASRTGALRVSLDDAPNDGAVTGETDNVWHDVERVRGGAGNDFLSGNHLNNLLHGGAGNDTLHGIGGNDALFGNGGNDRVFGGGGNDYLEGNVGNDSLYGEAGTDFYLGHDGDDWIYARDGIGETLNGGPGFDRAQRDASDNVISIEAFLA